MDGSPRRTSSELVGSMYGAVMGSVGASREALSARHDPPRQGLCPTECSGVQAADNGPARGDACSMARRGSHRTAAARPRARRTQAATAAGAILRRGTTPTRSGSILRARDDARRVWGDPAARDDSRSACRSDPARAGRPGEDGGSDPARQDAGDGLRPRRSPSLGRVTRSARWRRELAAWRRGDGCAGPRPRDTRVNARPAAAARGRMFSRVTTFVARTPRSRHRRSP